MSLDSIYTWLWMWFAKCVCWVRDVDVMEVGRMGSWMRGGDAGMEGCT
jgi:hypothetical protein